MSGGTARIGYLIMKCLFLYNPHSGKGRIAKKIAYIEKKLSEKYDEVDIVATQSVTDLETRVREGASRYDVILFSGGDGTFNNVLHGVGEQNVTLGYLPSGTVNDVARSLGIPHSVKGALKVALNGVPQKLDCMRINGSHYAMYVTAAGAFTSATYSTPQTKKKKFGRIAYAIHALKKNMKFEVFPISGTCDGHKFESHGVLVLVMRGRSIAGFPINKEASMEDGTLEIALVKQAKKPNVFQKFGKYFSLASLLLFGVRIKKRDIEFMCGEDIRIDTDENVVWDFDGEEGIRGNVHIELLRKRVTLIVPKNKKI